MVKEMERVLKELESLITTTTTTTTGDNNTTTNKSSSLNIDHPLPTSFDNDDDEATTTTMVNTHIISPKSSDFLVLSTAESSDVFTENNTCAVVFTDPSPSPSSSLLS